jgi:glycosyltransferase involved in cell wall biosynthesis
MKKGRLHIVHAAPFPYYSGGIDSWLAAFINIYNSTTNISIYCLGEPKDSMKKNFKIPSLKIKYFDGNLFASIFKLSFDLKKNIKTKDTVLILSTIPLGIILITNYINFKLNKVKTIVSVRGQITRDCILLKKSYLKTTLSFIAEFLTCHLADIVVSNGIDTNKYLLKYFGVDSVIIPNGILNESVRIRSGEKLILKKKKDSIIILHLGTMRPIKGIKFIKEAFLEYFSNSPNSKISLLFVGKGDSTLLGDLINFSDNVKLYGEQSDTNIFIDNSDYAINFSGGSGVSNSLIECLDRGIPVIAHDNLTFSQVLNNKNGILVKNKKEFISILRKIDNSEIIFDSELIKKSVKRFKWINLREDWHKIIFDAKE